MSKTNKTKAIDELKSSETKRFELQSEANKLLSILNTSAKGITQKSLAQKVKIPTSSFNKIIKFAEDLIEVKDLDKNPNIIAEILINKKYNFHPYSLYEVRQKLESFKSEFHRMRKSIAGQFFLLNDYKHLYLYNINGDFQWAHELVETKEGDEPEYFFRGQGVKHSVDFRVDKILTDELPSNFMGFIVNDITNTNINGIDFYFSGHNSEHNGRNVRFGLIASNRISSRYTPCILSSEDLSNESENSSKYNEGWQAECTYLLHKFCSEHLSVHPLLSWFPIDNTINEDKRLCPFLQKSPSIYHCTLNRTPDKQESKAVWTCWVMIFFNQDYSFGGIYREGSKVPKNIVECEYIIFPRRSIDMPWIQFYGTRNKLNPDIQQKSFDSFLINLSYGKINFLKQEIPSEIEGVLCAYSWLEQPTPFSSYCLLITSELKKQYTDSENVTKLLEILNAKATEYGLYHTLDFAHSFENIDETYENGE